MYNDFFLGKTFASFTDLVMRRVDTYLCFLLWLLIPKDCSFSSVEGRPRVHFFPLPADVREEGQVDWNYRRGIKPFLSVPISSWCLLKTNQAFTRATVREWKNRYMYHLRYVIWYLYRLAHMFRRSIPPHERLVLFNYIWHVDFNVPCVLFVPSSCFYDWF